MYKLTNLTNDCQIAPNNGVYDRTVKNINKDKVKHKSTLPRKKLKNHETDG
jgi:hypothetical protein